MNKAQNCASRLAKSSFNLHLISASIVPPTTSVSAPLWPPNPPRVSRPRYAISKKSDSNPRGLLLLAYNESSRPVLSTDPKPCHAGQGFLKSFFGLNRCANDAFSQRHPTSLPAASPELESIYSIQGQPVPEGSVNDLERPMLLPRAAVASPCTTSTCISETPAPTPNPPCSHP
jgi:hypothetical protein